MAPSQFPNVNPAPFKFARATVSIFGRSLATQLPPVVGYSRADLERLRFALKQSGADPALLDRVRQVMAARELNVPTPAPEIVLLNPSRRQRNAVSWRRHNPFDVAADAMQPQ
jgi:hypothetical protein